MRAATCRGIGQGLHLDSGDRPGCGTQRRGHDPAGRVVTLRSRRIVTLRFGQGVLADSKGDSANQPGTG